MSREVGEHRPSVTRALVVDDDPILRGLMRARLAGIVDEVVEAGDGLEAWQLLGANRFHLAVVDLMMPGLNGFALIQCMRGHPRTRHMPIVVVTSSDDRAAIDKALEVGASAFITKPVMWATFKAHIGHLLRLAATADAAERALAQKTALIEAHGALFAALAAVSHAGLRRAELAVDAGNDREAALRGAGHCTTAMATVERLRACHAMIARPEAVADTFHDLAGLLGPAVAAVRDRADGLDVRLVPTEPPLEAACAREAMIAAIALALSVLAVRAGAGASLAVDAVLEPDRLAIRLLVRGVAWKPIEVSEVAADLALTALQGQGSQAFDLALVRTLLVAHGGTLEPVADGLVLALPGESVRPLVERVRLVASSVASSSPASQARLAG